MQTECIPDIFGFEGVEGRQMVAAFDGGAITSDAGALLLGATDRVSGWWRCNAVRGTLNELHDLARHGNDVCEL
jgi:hypothetical protein